MAINASSHLVVCVNQKPKILAEKLPASGIDCFRLTLRWPELSLTLVFNDDPNSFETIEELIQCLEELKTNLRAEKVIH